MEQNSTRRGFTLIDLLVVVIIIAILAAIALPQYQKAVEKSRASQALVLLKGAYQAAAMYYMDKGSYPTSFAQMEFDVPWMGNTKWTNLPGAKDTKSNTDWSLQLYHASGGSLSLYMGRISGKYAGGGFSVEVVDSDGNVASGKIVCAERIHNGISLSSDLNAGDYCEKIMGGTLIPTVATFRSYSLP